MCWGAGRIPTVGCPSSKTWLEINKNPFSQALVNISDNWFLGMLLGSKLISGYERSSLSLTLSASPPPPLGFPLAPPMARPNTIRGFINVGYSKITWEMVASCKCFILSLSACFVHPFIQLLFLPDVPFSAITHVFAFCPSRKYFLANSSMVKGPPWGLISGGLWNSSQLSKYSSPIGKTCQGEESERDPYQFPRELLCQSSKRQRIQRCCANSGNGFFGSVGWNPPHL